MIKSFIKTFIIIFIIICIIFLIDYFNIPSLIIKYNKIDYQNWLQSILSILGTILGASIGGLISYCIFKHQIDNDKKINEDIIVTQNYPILNYSFYNSSNPIKDNDAEIIVGKNYGKKDIKLYYSILKIENLGLNIAQNIRISITSPLFKNCIYTFLSDKPIYILKNDDYINIAISTYLKIQRSGIFNANILCEYEDVFGKTYKQNIRYTMHYSNICDSSSVYSNNCVIDIIEKEKRIN